MNVYIKQLVESYFDSTEQMNNVLKNAKKLMQKDEQMKETRIDFIQTILGKNTFRKLENNGLFAPIPLNGIKLTGRDFDDLYPEYDGEKTEKIIDILAAKYDWCDFVMREDRDMQIKTSVIFKTIDDIINFFYNVFAAYKKVYRREDINWKPLVKKFRNYLK